MRDISMGLILFQGVLYLKMSVEPYFDEARQQVLDLLSEFKNLEHMEWSDISSDIKRHLKRYFLQVLLTAGL
jgi:hypothetical protein